MEFAFVEVIKTKENWFYIEWDMTPGSGESVDDYKFQIWWSFDPASGYVAVSDETGDPIEIDGAVGPLSYTHEHNQYNFNKDRYYRVLAIDKFPPPTGGAIAVFGQTEELDPLLITTFGYLNAGSSADGFFSNKVWIGMYKDGVHETIKHAEDTLYTMYHGEPCMVIKRKSFGARCPVCWSQERRQVTKSHCDTCHGTGFVIGYYQPILIQISFDSDPRKADGQKEWENVYDSKRARLCNYPLLRPKDLIVNIDDYKRYVITHVETTKIPRLSESAIVLSKQNYILSQLLTMEELNPDDNEYFIDVDNIPEVPQAEEGNTGSTQPYFNDHMPVTVSAPLIITDGQQHLELDINTDDFIIQDGKLKLKYGAGTIGVDSFISAEIISTPLKVCAINDDGEVIVANYTNVNHLNRVVGISLNVASVGTEIFVQKLGILSNIGWNWNIGESIFFDAAGNLTQTPQTEGVGFFMIIAKPLLETSIDILLRSPVIRAIP